jgi:hypothetical protein
MTQFPEGTIVDVKCRVRYRATAAGSGTIYAESLSGALEVVLPSSAELTEAPPPLKYRDKIIDPERVREIINNGAILIGNMLYQRRDECTLVHARCRVADLDRCGRHADQDLTRSGHRRVQR